MLDSAEQAAKKAGDSFVTAEYLLLSLAMTGETGRILKTAGVTPQGLNKAIADLQARPLRRQRHGRKFL